MMMMLIWMYCMTYDKEHEIVVFRHNSLATPEYPKVEQEKWPEYVVD